jgi:hypothetical protein
MLTLEQVNAFYNFLTLDDAVNEFLEAIGHPNTDEAYEAIAAQLEAEGLHAEAAILHAVDKRAHEIPA